ncbi:MAG TPA: tripartite tricarboxylate transporter substrate binding protein [Alphaproteobacteria bacterium]|jgi:tripartite-type tricarboxylate transporter receptor subunit TctC
MPRTIVAAVLLALAVFAPARAEDFPNRPITLVVPFPPGGIADITARPLAAAMEKILKQPVTVANKQGAAGAVGMASVATAKPDGYTLLVALVSISVIPEVDKLFGRPPAYTRDQLVGIARLNADPPMLVVNSDYPWKTLKDFVSDPQAKSGTLVYSSSGIYGASHVPMEMLMAAAGLKMRHLPTTGGAPAMTAVLGKHAAMWNSPPAVAAPHLASGKIRALAHYGAKRLPDFPDVPTMKELGYDIEYYLWTGLFAPKGVPADILKTIGATVAKVVEDPDFKAAMAKAKMPIAYQDAAEFKAWWDKDAEILAAVVKKIGKMEDKK